MRKHTVYVDQSGKIGDSSTSTGLAFSDEQGKDFTNVVHIRKRHKQSIKQKAIDDLGGRKRYLTKLFSVGIFMLIQNDIHRIREVRIDKEYEGKKKYIKNHLTNFLDNNSLYGPNHYPQICVTRIHGELENPECHNLAYKARKKSLEHILYSDYGFLKGMMLTSNK